MNNELISKLAAGQVAVKHDGKSKGQLEAVIHAAFTNSNRVPAGISRHYFKGMNDWAGSDHEPTVPVESLKQFTE